MKGMPLAFDFEGKGVLNLELLEKNKSFFSDKLLSSYFFNNKKNCFLNSNSSSFCEPTSVLDSARLIPSRPTSSSTLSSSLAGGGGAASTDTAGVAAVSDANNPSPKWQDSTTATSSNAAAAAGGGADSAALLPVPPPLEIGATPGGGTNPEKFAMEDWESVLSESVTAVSPTTQDQQSILRLIMGDVEDPLSKVLQIGGGGGSAASEFDYSGGFGVVDQGFGGDQFSSGFMLPNFVVPNNNRSSAEKIGNLASSNPISPNLPTHNFKFSHNIMNNPSSLSNNLVPLHHHHQTAFDSEIKPPIFNMNHYQTHNPSFLPLSSYPQQQQQDPNIYAPPQAKRHNPGGNIDAETGHIPKGPFNDTGQHPELFSGRHQLTNNNNINPLQLLPHHYLQQQKPRTCDELVGQQAVVDQLYKAAEFVQTGNPPLAQGILARLNHHHHHLLSPIGKPFYRAAFYFKESLQHLLQHTTINNNTPLAAVIHKISAYKFFSEISPLVQFSNFTSNQAILESLEGFDRIRIVDFDIGYGGQWASLMQELALRGGDAGPPQLRITALASSSSHDHLELGLTRENLIQFANEINIALEFEAVNIDSLSSNSWVPPFHSPENEAVVVNLPVGSVSSDRQLSVLRFVKQLSPRIVVSVDRGCDRTDLPFANHVIHALQSYSNLLESLDAVNVNMEALQKIERFLIQPGIERIVLGRFRSPEKTQNWRALFLSSGFSPVMFSNFAESQAECVVKRTPVRGFQVEKRQSSLVLCWQRKELISASAWRC